MSTVYTRDDRLANYRFFWFACAWLMKVSTSGHDPSPCPPLLERGTEGVRSTHWCHGTAATTRHRKRQACRLFALVKSDKMISGAPCVGKEMAHQHEAEHHHGAEGTRPLQISLGIVALMMVVEVVGGLVSGSLALLSDAGHMLVDGLALALSLFALTLAQRPATSTRTYGFHRAEIMAALANGVTLVVVSLFIFYEAYQRFLEPPGVRRSAHADGGHHRPGGQHRGDNPTQKQRSRQSEHQSRFLAHHRRYHIISRRDCGRSHHSADFLYPADPIMAIAIGIIILWSGAPGYRGLGHPSRGYSRHIKVDRLVERMKSVPGVLEVHDLHTWTITSGIYAVSAHLLIEDQMVSRAGRSCRRDRYAVPRIRSQAHHAATGVRSVRRLPDRADL